MAYNRRVFLKQISVLTAGAVWLPACGQSPAEASAAEMPFDISLAQWSLHRMLEAGELDNLDFPQFAKTEFGINAVEYVNRFFADKAKDKTYLSDLKMRAEDNGVRSLLIMIDGEGSLGDTDPAARSQAVENHFPWIEAAQFIGGHAIRVNAAGDGSPEAVKGAVVESLGELSEFAAPMNINVIVENHGGYSSDAAWLADAIAQVDMPNCGTLPDFGNFTIDREAGKTYDRYQGMKELMPYAKAVSAKCYDFGPEGEETTIDFGRMIDIVLEAGYDGYIGIEYEGSRLSEVEGVKAAKQLLEKIGKSR